MFPDEFMRPITSIPLQAHVEELRRRCEAVACLQGGYPSYLEQVSLFRRYATETRLAFHTPLELSRQADEEGNEHQVWFYPPTNTYLKLTWPDFFGLLVVYRSDEDPRASPIDYLERWLLHNELFGDSVQFLGVVEQEGKLRMVIEQPAIEGLPASLEQINTFFTQSGWKRFSLGEDIAYFDPIGRVVISDTHRGNIILMEDGLLAPIDLRVQPLQGALLDAVVKLCGIRN
jgi:Serine/Threonine/Tyrosine Kinase found in polyvalent proteins